MNAERWKKVRALFDVAVDMEPAARGRFLDRACGADRTLRSEVEKLLSSSDEAGSFLEEPAAGQVASAILQPTQILPDGGRFAHYKIIRRIGVGGMGEVYLAEDEKLDRRVAIKILNERFEKNDSHIQRFIREAKAASSLNHPNILVIHEISVGEGANFIVSEFVDGRTLRDLISRNDLTLQSTLDIAIQIAEALVAAHGAGIVHRDIKPENIVVRPDGYVKVLDFGLAKLLDPPAILTNGEKETVRQNHTAQGLILGTVNYMSPEQAIGAAIDERTDIFSLGVVLYESVSGSTPFQGNSMSETLANLINAEPSPLKPTFPNVPDELQRIISKALQKDRNDRYRNSTELLADLTSLKENITFNEKFGRFHDKKTNESTAFLARDTHEVPLGDNATGTVKTKRAVRPGAVALILLLVMSALGLGYYFYAVRQNTSAGERRSLAVMPFANASQDPNAEYLADGVTESIINNLAQLSGLKVMSRNSSFRFKADQSDTRAIAAALNVDTLVTGDIKRLGDKLIINVRLINASDDSQIWGKQYVRAATDVIAAQNEIAQSVAQNLKVKITRSDTLVLNKRYTDNAEAYQLYLRGRFHVFKLLPDEIRQGIAYFQQAIDLDPNYALAYAGISDAYRSLAVGSEITSRESFARSKAAANRAIELDEALSDGHAALGMTLFWGEWDWQGAENQYKRALELNPNDTNAHLFYAHFLSNMGRHPEALREIALARELDPLSPFVGALEGQFLFHAGKLDEALDRLQKTLELAPNFWMTHLFASSAYVEMGRFEEALAEARKAKQLSSASTYSIGVESFALAKLGRRDEARQVLNELLEMSKNREIPATHIALAYNGLGDTQKSLEWLERSFTDRDPKMAFLKVDSKWNNLRTQPRFIELMKKMNFQ